MQGYFIGGFICSWANLTLYDCPRVSFYMFNSYTIKHGVSHTHCHHDESDSLSSCMIGRSSSPWSLLIIATIPYRKIVIKFKNPKNAKPKSFFLVLNFKPNNLFAKFAKTESCAAKGSYLLILASSRSAALHGFRPRLPWGGVYIAQWAQISTRVCGYHVKVIHA